MSEPIKWGDIFEDPDNVGATEYAAVHDGIAGSSAIGDLGFGEEMDPEAEMNDEQLDMIGAMLDEFMAHASTAKKKLAQLREERDRL